LLNILRAPLFLVILPKIVVNFLTNFWSTFFSHRHFVKLENESIFYRGGAKAGVSLRVL
jgi:hypothetical protein